jgi:hypothetical protein
LDSKVRAEAVESAVRVLICVSIECIMIVESKNPLEEIADFVDEWIYQVDRWMKVDPRDRRSLRE